MPGDDPKRTLAELRDMTAFGGTADISRRRANTGDAMLGGATPAALPAAAPALPAAAFDVEACSGSHLGSGDRPRRFLRRFESEAGL